MNYTFTSNLTKSDFDQFALKNKYATFFQSSKWAGVKDNWQALYTGVYKDKVLVGVCLVLKRSLVLKYNFMYAPRGPLLDFDDKKLLGFYLENLKKLAKEHSAIALTIDPYVKRASYSMQQAIKNKAVINYDDQLLTVFKAYGYDHKGFSKDIHDTIQPRFQPVIVLNKEGLSAYENSRGFKNGQKARDGNVKIKRISLEEINEFVEVIQKTEEAKNISLRGENYFSKLLKNYGNDSLVSIAYLDLEAELQSLINRKKDMQNRLDNPTIKEGRRREYESQLNSISKEIAYIDKKFKERGKTVNIAGLLAVYNGSKAELLYAGMDRDFMKYLGSNSNYVDAVNWARENNCDYLYFGGSSGYLNEGIDRFKATFNPTLEEYLGEFIFINKPTLNYLFEKAQAIRHKYLSRD